MRNDILGEYIFKSKSELSAHVFLYLKLIGLFCKNLEDVYYLGEMVSRTANDNNTNNSTVFSWIYSG